MVPRSVLRRSGCSVQLETPPLLLIPTRFTSQQWSSWAMEAIECDSKEKWVGTAQKGLQQLNQRLNFARTALQAASVPSYHSVCTARGRRGKLRHPTASMCSRGSFQRLGRWANQRSKVQLDCSIILRTPRVHDIVVQYVQQGSQSWGTVGGCSD